MRIRNKLLVLTVAFISLYTLGLLSVITVMVYTKFLAIEADLARSDIDRAINAFKVESSSLEVTVRDYAFWDSSWLFARGGNPRYVEKDIGPTPFENLNVSVLALYDASGRKIYARCRDGEGRECTCDFFPEVVTGSELRRIREPVSDYQVHDGMPVLAVSVPILHSDGSGPSAGFFLMARSVDDAFIEALRERIGVYVELLHEPFPGDLQNIRRYGNVEAGMFRLRSECAITGYIRFTDSSGAPAFTIKTTTPRALKAQSANVTASMLILFGTLTLFFIFSLSVAFRYWVVTPLSILENVVDSIILESGARKATAAPGVGDSVNQEERIAALFSRHDEIGHIAKIIAEMNTRVRDAHEAVRKTNENLEDLVAERTAALITINRKLEMFRKILENTSEAVIITDLGGNIIDMNDALCAMSGYSRDELLGRNARMLNSGRHDSDFFERIQAAITETGHWEGEVWDRRKDGSLCPKWQTINVIRDEIGQPLNYISVSSDISVIKEAEERLNHLAYYDPLTNLPNRMLFSDRLEHQIACAKRSSTPFALLFIDLDRFKNVNDSLGHVAGDSLLVKVSTRLAKCIRDSDTLCRIGGDEFTMILPDLSREENAGIVASSVVRGMSESFDIDGSEVYVGASIGIALYPKDGLDAETLLRKGDAAMYLAKEAGRGAYCYASSDMERANRGRLEIETKMHKALELNEFRLYYQPQTLIAEARPGSPAGLSGAEALIRWNREDNLIIPPGDFLPVAEETGFITPLGDWVLMQACSDAKRWLDTGLRVPVSVNVAARQFDSGNFVERVRSALSTSGLPGEMLQLEVTESGFMRNIAHVSDIMRKIREMGVKFAIDDFGTGYCSLQYLNRLPVDCLKIDQSFVRSMDDSQSGGDIVSAIISMARAFGLSSVAEGVETLEQLDRLRSRGCDIVQGFVVARPLPFDDFLAYLER